jgi:hypothetical protein
VARKRIAVGSWVAIMPTMATSAAVPPAAMTSRRPIRSDHDEAGNAASAEAIEPTVATIPIRASSRPIDAR